MPRGRAAKKRRRDAQATESFFGQAALPAPNTESSSSQSAQQKEPDAPTYPSGNEYQKFRNFILAGGPAVPPDEKLEAVRMALLARLSLEHRQAEAKAPPRISNLGLKQVRALKWRDEYEKACRDCAEKDNSVRDRNQTERENLESRSDEKQPPSECVINKPISVPDNFTLKLIKYRKLESSHPDPMTWFRLCKLRYDDIMIQLRYPFIRWIRLFNVEKRFGLQREAFTEVMFEDANDSGLMPSTKAPMTLRQIFNSPETLLLKPDKIKSRGKKSDPKDAFRKNCAKTLELLQAQKRLINIMYGKLNKAQTKSSPIASKFKDADIPRDVPEKTHWHLCDLDYSSMEVEDLIPIVDKLRDEALRILMYWYCSSREAWQYGVKEIYGMPKMQEYEYNRIQLAALDIMVTDNYLRVAEFFKGTEGSLLLTPPLAEALKLDDDQTFEQIKSAWLISTGACQAEDFHPSIEDLVTHFEEMWVEEVQPALASRNLWPQKL